MDILFLNQSPEGTDGYDPTGEIQDQLDGYASDGTTIDIGFPDDYPGAKVKSKLSSQLGYNGLHHEMETTPLIRKVAWAEEEGYDAVIQSNTFDPGVEAGRLAVRIPVVGLFRVSLHVAANLSNRIGVVVPLKGHIKEVERILHRYRMDEFVTGIRAHELYGGAEEMERRKDEIQAETVRKIDAIVEEHEAEYIIPLGGALIPYIVSPADLERECGIPVINTKAVGIQYTEMLVRLGMSQSERTYPKGDLAYEDFITHQNE